MSAKTGKDWHISKGTGTYMGGKILGATPIIDGRDFSEVGTSQRRMVTPPVKASATPRLRFTMNVQRFADYINTNAIITAEGAVPAHTLYTTEGTNPHDLTSAKVDSCEIQIRRGESIKAIIDVIGKTWGTTDYQAGSDRDEDPIDFSKLNTLTIGGNSITAWRRCGFRVNNNVIAEFLGITITPTEVFERHPIYTGVIEKSIVGEADYFSDASQPAVTRDVVVAINDNQGTPVTTTYTFADCLIQSSRKPIRGLDLVIERIEWKGGKLTIT